MKTTEVIIILDRSGSMDKVKADTIGGFNTFLAEQKALPDKATVTLIQFNNEYNPVCSNEDITNLPPLNETTFVPRGGTALFDAIGKTISDVSTRHMTKKPDQVLFVVITDGEENSSEQYSLAMIEKLIEDIQAKGWEVLFIGSELATLRQAVSYGVKNVMGFTADSIGTRNMYANLSATTQSYRSTGKLNELPDESDLTTI